jgi:hypothetical protein
MKELYNAEDKKRESASDFYIIALGRLGRGFRQGQSSVCDADVCAKAGGFLFDLPHVAAQTQ